MRNCRHYWLTIFGAIWSLSLVATELPRLHGTLSGGEEKLASLLAPGATTSKWYSEGQAVGKFRLAKVEKGKVVLADESGKLVDVFLIGAAAVSSDSADPVPFSRRWINSRANPMLELPQDISPEIARAWASMTKAERDEFEAFYLRHGWRMIRVEVLAAGALTVEWENIYKEQRKQRVRENMEQFVKGLSPEQKAMWDTLNAGKRRVRVGGDFSEEQKRDLERTRQLADKFKNSLSPGQEAERATLPDFTKGDW